MIQQRRKIEQRRKIKITITLTPPIARRVDRLAKLGKLTRSECVEALLVDSLDQQEAVIQAATDPVLMNAIAKVMTEPGMMASMFSSLRSELSTDQLDLFKHHLGTVQHNIRNRPPGLAEKVVKPGRRK
jgi:predicted transcriptional regulator